MIDVDKYYTLDTVHNGLLTDKNISLKYLMCLINSRLIRFLYENSINEGGKVFAQVKIMYVNPLPIKKVKSDKQQPFIDKADAMLQLNKDLQEQTQKFLNLLKSDFQLEKPSKKIEDFYLLDWSDFNKELQKNKILLVGEIRDDWHDRFERYKKQALDLKSQIDQTDKEIDRMVYDLYGLTDEEIQIVENS